VHKLQGDILNYEVSGTGPVVVLLHGYLSSLRYWDELRAVLEADHTVIAIDLLGFGGSPKPRRMAYDYDDHLAWVQRTLEHCGVQGPVVLAGHSMGALLSLRYASCHPENVRKLLLLNPPLFKDAQEARRELASNLFYRASLYWGGHRVICPFMRLSFMKALMRACMPKRYRGMEQYMFAASLEARSRSLRNVIEAQQSLCDLRKLDLPITLVQGKYERQKYIENLKRLIRKPNWHVLLADTGHHTLVDEPELVAGLLAS